MVCVSRAPEKQELRTFASLTMDLLNREELNLVLLTVKKRKCSSLTFSHSKALGALGKEALGKDALGKGLGGITGWEKLGGTTVG